MNLGILWLKRQNVSKSQQNCGFIAIFRLMIHSHKGMRAARVTDVMLGVSLSMRGSLVTTSPANGIWIEFCGEISRNMEH